MSPSESPEVSKKISATGEVPVKAVLSGSESTAPPPLRLDWPIGVNTVVAPLKLPRPEMLTTGGGFEIFRVLPTYGERSGIDISKESTLGKSAEANNTTEAFGPIPIVVKFESFVERKLF